MLVLIAGSLDRPCSPLTRFWQVGSKRSQSGGTSKVVVPPNTIWDYTDSATDLLSHHNQTLRDEVRGDQDWLSVQLNSATGVLHVLQDRLPQFAAQTSRESKRSEEFIVHVPRHIRRIARASKKPNRGSVDLPREDRR